MRIIIYTGKGGVGKTSTAAATAVRLAAEGLRTLVVSTDAAHSLSDSFDLPLDSEPVMVSDRLWGQEIDSLRETEKHWGAVQGWLSRLMTWADLDDISSEEMLVFPGLEELFSLLEILRAASSGAYDAIVVDCAPTGETLRLLSYPDLLDWWLEKIFPHERRLLKVVRPVAKLVAGGLELPDDRVLDSVGQLADKLKELQKLLTDPEVTSVRLVVNPEKMVIAEARRAFTYLNLYGFHTDAVIVNRVLPEEAGTGYWAGWLDIHRKYEEEIANSFQPLPILRIPMMAEEVCGLTMLKRLGDAGFHSCAAGGVLHRGLTQVIRREREGYALELTLPFVEKEELKLSQRGEELTVQAGPYKRKVLLPRSLMGRPIVSARFAGKALVIQFGNLNPEGE